MSEEFTEFFRCEACGRAYEMNEMSKKEMTKCKCGGGRFIPARLNAWEVVKYLATHPKVLLETVWAKLKPILKAKALEKADEKIQELKAKSKPDAP